jgi:hypothetical protein
VIGATGFTSTVVVVKQPPGAVYVILAVPPDAPLTIPEEAPTVATPVAPEDHVPPAVAFINVMVVPWQTDVAPLIAVSAFTEMTIVAVQPKLVVYVIVAVPTDTPLRVLELLMVATAVLLLAHVPPPAMSLSVMFPPGQTVAAPEIGAMGLTVMVLVIKQLFGAVYEMIAVPAPLPVTTPVESPMPATPGLLLAQVPPVVMSLRVMLLPLHSLAGPLMDDGSGSTVNTVVTAQPAGLVYVIVAVPGDVPVTMPVAGTTPAMATLLLAHVPPVIEALRRLLFPLQTEVTPEITGTGFTVTVFEADEIFPQASVTVKE